MAPWERGGIDPSGLATLGSMQDGAIVLKRAPMAGCGFRRSSVRHCWWEFRSSGLSGAQFAKVVGMKYQTLMGWMARQRRRQASQVKGGQPAFVEAVVARRSDSAALRIDFGNGMTMHLEAACDPTNDIKRHLDRTNQVVVLILDASITKIFPADESLSGDGPLGSEAWLLVANFLNQSFKFLGSGQKPFYDR